MLSVQNVPWQLFFKEINQVISESFLSGSLHTYLSIVVLVGAKAFMRFFSGRISQHHLHLHSIHRLAVEHRHGIICTLESQRKQEASSARRINTARRFDNFNNRREISLFFIARAQSKRQSPVCLHTSHIQPSSQELDGSPTGNQSDWRQAEKEKVHSWRFPLI